MKPMRGTAVKAAERSKGEFPRELKTRRATAFGARSNLLQKVADPRREKSPEGEARVLRPLGLLDRR